MHTIRDAGKIALFLILAMVILMAPGFDALARDPQDVKVRVGYYENEVFQEGASEGAVKTGYAYEYYRKLSEYTGWNYEYVYGRFDELYEMLLSGDIDLLAGLAYRDDRADIIGYPDAPMGNETYTLVKHEEDSEITADPATFTGKRIGVLKSAIAETLANYLNEHKVKAEVITYGDYETLFDAFDTGTLDILAAEGDGAYGRDHTEVLITFGTSDYYLCVNKERQDLLDELNMAEAQLSAEEPNYLSSLRSKYYSSSVSSHSFSVDERHWINSHDTLTIGYLQNYLPYSATDKNGEVTGIIKDIIPEMLGEFELDRITVNYVGFSNYDEMISAVTSDAIDVAFPVGGGLYYSEENGIYQSNPVASASTDLVFKGEYKSSHISHFAVNENNRMQYYYIRTNFPEAEITMYPSIEDCLQAVLSGSVSATTLNGLRANDILRNSKYDGLYLRQLSKTDDRSFGVKIGNEGLLRLLNHGINILGVEYAQNIAYRYVGNLYTYTFSDMLRDNMWLFITIVVCIISLFLFLVIRDMERSKRASRLKSDFVSNMSHEIRTPITAILGMNELIRRESENESVLKYSNNIEKAGESLLGIINDILDFSKIEAGRMELVNHEYSLPDLIFAISPMIEYRAASKDLKFTMEIDKNLPEKLFGDEQKIKQILTNLLTNAVKYTEKGSIKLKIELESLDDNEAKMEVRVEDTGIGIKQEDMGMLYSAFDRLDLEKTGTIEGSGLGLTITQRMLELMGSKIQVTSTYGEGSCFYFTLSQKVTDKEPIGDFDQYRYEKECNIRKRKEATFTAPSARILIVDDTPMNLQVIEGLLKKNIMQIDTAVSGEECIAKFENNLYDLVFLDYRMPGMDGLDTFREMSRRYPEKVEKTPIISLTANVLQGAREQMIKAGFTDYLTKPIKLDDLEKALLTYLPKEKIQLIEDRADDSTEADTVGIPAELAKIEMLDIEEGLNYCGDTEDYLDAVEVYLESVDKKAKQLEEYLENKDMKELSLLVHSIKSTSNAIGAIGVGESAKKLEEQAIQAASDEKSIEEITEATRSFLILYRELGNRLNDAMEDQK